MAHIDALNVAEEAVARAREGVGPKSHHSVDDLNVATLEPDACDVVVAHSILHHGRTSSTVSARSSEP